MRVRRHQHGFTLLELIIVIAILAILSVAVVLVINPAETLARARDSQRLSDLAAINTAITLAAVEQSNSGNWNPNTQNADGCADEANPLVYVSVPISVEVAPDDLPSGWDYKQSADASTVGQVNGDGWVPVDLTSGGSVSPLSNFPLDPVNTFASNLYFTYTCTRNPNFELTAKMESTRYRIGGGQDKTGEDGGDDVFVYEVGSDLGLDPKAPIAYWPLDGGTSGSITDGQTAGFEDSSGNGHHGTANNNGSGMAWVSGVLGGAVDFDGVDDFVDLGSPLSSPSAWTYAAWIYPPVAAGSGCDGILGQVNNPRLTWGQCGSSDEAIGTLLSWSLVPNYRSASTGDLTLNEWHYAVMVVDLTDLGNQTIKVYADGILDGSISWSTGTSIHPSNVHRLNRRDSSNAYEGYIDEVAIYDRALTADEIQFIYDATKP